MTKCAYRRALDDCEAAPKMPQADSAAVPGRRWLGRVKESEPTRFAESRERRGAADNSPSLRCSRSGGGVTDRPRWRSKADATCCSCRRAGATASSSVGGITHRRQRPRLARLVAGQLIERSGQRRPASPGDEAGIFGRRAY